MSTWSDMAVPRPSDCALPEVPICRFTSNGLRESVVWHRGVAFVKVAEAVSASLTRLITHSAIAPAVAADELNGPEMDADSRLFPAEWRAGSDRAAD